MDIYNEHVFDTPRVSNLKNKPSAFSSRKNKTKTALSDVKNTIHSRNASTAVNEIPKFEDAVHNSRKLKKFFKSSQPSAVKPGPSVLLSTYDGDMGIYHPFAVGCRCQSNLQDYFPDLPEELHFRGDVIDRFATVWCSNTNTVSDTSSDCEEFHATSKMKDWLWHSLDNSIPENEPFLNLFDEVYNIMVPVVDAA